MATALDSKEFPLHLYERTDDPLGGGSYGTVYRYERKDGKKDDEQLPFAIAVKEIILKRGNSDKHVIREHETMKEISHKYIVRYFGRFATKRTTRFVMELCSTDLDSMKKCRKFSEVEVAAILWQMLTALNYLHQRDIVHRDVKPSNVLLMIDGQSYDLKTVSFGNVTKLRIPCDFGLARFYSSEAEDTVFMTTVGTEAYSAPEIRFNLDKQSSSGRSDDTVGEDPSTTGYTESCDTFSAGVIAHELATGKHYQDVTFYTDFAKLEATLKQNCDPNLLSLLKCMLHHDKRKRSTVEELLQHVFIKHCEQYIKTEENMRNQEAARKIANNESLDISRKQQEDMPPPIESQSQLRIRVERNLNKRKQKQVNGQLWKATKTGDVESMKSAFRQGAQTDYYKGDPYIPSTSLHVAADRGYIAAAVLLLNEGAKANAVMTEDVQWTALMLACRNGHHQVVKLLLEHGASVNMKNKGLNVGSIYMPQSTYYDDETALHIAAERAHLSCVRLLVEVGKANVNVRDSNAKTPLARAEKRILGNKRDYNSVISFLKENGATK